MFVVPISGPAESDERTTSHIAIFTLPHDVTG
jgi:hypothetical protein